MKIRVYALFLAFLVSIPLLGMKRGLELEISSTHQLAAHPGQADDQIPLLDDCKALIVALCSPATRNVLMKVNAFYHNFASPRNIAKLLPLGLKLSVPDTIKELFSAVNLQSTTRAKYLFAQRPDLKLISHPMVTLYAKMLTLPGDISKRFQALLPTEGKTYVQAHYAQKDIKWPALHKAIANQSLPKDETWSTFVEKRAQHDVCPENRALTHVSHAIFEGNIACVKALINNKHFKTSLAKQRQQPSFWESTFSYCCMSPDEAIFDPVLMWLLEQRFDGNEGVHKTQLHEALLEVAVMIIDTNKHQILTKFLNHTKHEPHFNKLILNLLCYAYEYKKYDCVNTLLSHAQFSSGEQPTTLDHHEHEYLRTYRQLLATLFPHNNQDIRDTTVRARIVSLFKSFITADNTEYLGISLDTISTHPCFNKVATELLQYALVEKKYAYVQKILTYCDKLVPSSVRAEDKLLDPEESVNNPWVKIFETVYKHDDTRMICSIIQWIIQSAPIYSSDYLWFILKPVNAMINPDGITSAQDIFDAPRMQDLVRILEILQEVSSSNQKYAHILNDLLSKYLEFALLQGRYHSTECLLNGGAYPSLKLQAQIIIAAKSKVNFSFTSDILCVKDKNPALFTRLVMMCKARQEDSRQTQKEKLLQMQNSLFTRLNLLIEQADLAGVQALLASCQSHTCLPVITYALKIVIVRKKNVLADIVQLQANRAPQSSSQLQSLREKARRLEVIRSSLVQRQVHWQYICLQLKLEDI